jgi:AraC-like DNA-binding protein
MGRIATYFFLTIGLMMFVFTCLLVTARKRTVVTRWLGTFIFCLGYIWFYFGLYRESGLYWAPWLIYTDIFMEYIAGPAMCLYTGSLVGKKINRRFGLRLLPFIPAIIFLAYLLLFQPAANLPRSFAVDTNPEYFADPLLSILNTLADAYFFSCVILSTLTIFKTYKAGTTHFRKAFRGVAIYFLNGTLTIIGFFAGHLLRDNRLLAVSVLLNGLNTTYLFFLSYRYPEHTQRALKLAKQGGATETSNSAIRTYYAPTAMTTPAPRGQNLSKILTELKRLLEEERVYRDSEISVQSLSSKLGIQNHQLSQILHESLGMSFRGYIKNYRLEEAKLLLVQKPERSVLDIAYAVGFNSKSTFNSAFLTATGLTPSDFRKKAAP